MSPFLIVGLTILVVFAIRWAVLALVGGFYSLSDWYAEERGSWLARLLLFPVWLVLAVFAFVFMLVGVACGISLAKKTYKWFNH